MSITDNALKLHNAVNIYNMYVTNVQLYGEMQ